MCSQHAEASRGPGLREPVPGKGGGGGSVGLWVLAWRAWVAAEPMTGHSQGTGVNKVNKVK